MKEQVIDLVNQFYPQLVALRRELHQYPELSNQEYETVAKLRKMLDEVAIEHEQLPNLNAIVANIAGYEQGRVVAIRADIDALPIQEVNTVSYCSKNEGVMHACGHDVHTTILVGAGLILNELRDQFKGGVKLLFQPAEETDGGAKRMIEAGCLNNPNVDYALGLHCYPSVDVGQVSFCHDVAHASSDMISIEVFGELAHGAYPDLGVDAIVATSSIINALQTLVSRNTSPFDPVVLSLGTIKGEGAGNIICSHVTVTGIIRTFSETTRELMKKRLVDVCESVARAHQARATVTIKAGYDTLINDEFVLSTTKACASELLGEPNVLIQKHGSLGVEDFAYFAQAVPSCFYNLGTKNEALGITAGLHTNTFDIDEEAIKVGVTLQVLTTLKLLGGNV